MPEIEKEGVRGTKANAFHFCPSLCGLFIRKSITKDNWPENAFNAKFNRSDGNWESKESPQPLRCHYETVYSIQTN